VRSTSARPSGASPTIRAEGEMPPPAFGITAGDHTNFGWRGTFMDFFWGRGLLTQPCLFHGKMLLVALQ
jgi:hypothetical protein